jgi:hypothetical protein
MRTRFISTRVHGIIDYLTGGALLFAPRLLGFEHCGAASFIPKAVGSGILVQSLLTDYELGVVRRIPMRTHLRLDLGTGALLAASPWLFRFHRYVWAPHVLVGLMEVALSLTTNSTPSDGFRKPGRIREGREEYIPRGREAERPQPQSASTE